jgi:hypothetical protein
MDAAARPEIETMTEPEALVRICENLEMLFPEGGGGPYWGQKPYRSALFEVFAASHGTCHLGRIKGSYE